MAGCPKRARTEMPAPAVLLPARKGRVPTLVAETGSKLQLGPGNVFSWMVSLPEEDDVCV